MSNSQSPEMSPNTKETRRKKRRLPLVLSLVLLAEALFLTFKMREGDFSYKDFPSAFGAIQFFIETVWEGTITSGPLRIEVHQGTSMSGDKEWTTEETAQLELLIQDAQDFFEEVFGPPPSHTEGLVVFITKVTNASLAEHAGEGVVAGFGHTVSVGPFGARARMIPTFPLFDTLHERNEQESVSAILHELKHAWGDDEDDFPNAWIEGQAVLAEMLYARRLGESPLLPVISMDNKVLFDDKAYEENNTQELRTINWEKDPLERRILAYRMAGYAWYLWYEQHPDFFPKLAQKIDAFYEKNKHRPTYAEMIMLSDQVEPSFSRWLANQNIFPAQTK